MADEESRRSRLAGRNKMLICRDVDVTYDGTQVLFGVDFDVEQGELVALLGTNGAGKSTLMRAIAGIAEPSNGAIFLDGEDITHERAHKNARRGIVMVPGGHAVFPTLTVEENLQATDWSVDEEAGGTEAIFFEPPVLVPHPRQPNGPGEFHEVSLGRDSRGGYPPPASRFRAIDNLGRLVITRSTPTVPPAATSPKAHVTVAAWGVASASEHSPSSDRAETTSGCSVAGGVPPPSCRPAMSETPVRAPPPGLVRSMNTLGVSIGFRRLLIDRAMGPS
jgi:ABC-type Fe3+/spermidine/putrescine transport system ATPase subunit